MPDSLPDLSEAVVICTRNRSGELKQTLRSVAAQSGAEGRLVLVVDGSDPDEVDATAQVVSAWTDELPFHYFRYSGAPAGTRQRNTGIDQLPRSVTIVHFLDDDVTLRPNYFHALSTALRQHPRLLGVGGIILDPDASSPTPPEITVPHKLFLLRTDAPSRVLASGQTTPAWPAHGRALQPAEWLSTCASSYRRNVFEHHRFDPAVEGPSPRLEDLDFSYRVAREGTLAVAPEAHCVHRFSSTNRQEVSDSTCERVARRYWFVEKNLGSGPHRLAFWWSMLGKFLILLVSSHPDRNEALHGFLRGIQTVWRRNHSLLRPE